MAALPVKILIIEDEPDVRIYLTNLLHSHGYEVMAVDGIEDGLTFIQKQHPALVVLDAMLPGDDARRFYMDLRAKNDVCRIPVVILSTLSRRALWGSRFYRVGGAHRRLAGPDAFLTKPPEAEDFLDVVQRLTKSAL
ncbi:MAG: response regulator [Desulfobacteraceae bacterium]